MAKFLKIVSSDPTNPEVLIGIDQITYVARGDDAGADPDEIVTVFFGATGFAKISITSTGAAEATAVLRAVNAALTANPGGLISTVNSPLVTAQVVAPATSGRQLITSAAVYQVFSQVEFT